MLDVLESVLETILPRLAYGSAALLLVVPFSCVRREVAGA